MWRFIIQNGRLNPWRSRDHTRVKIVFIICIDRLYKRWSSEIMLIYTYEKRHSGHVIAGLHHMTRFTLLPFILWLQRKIAVHILIEQNVIN